MQPLLDWLGWLLSTALGGALATALLGGTVLVVNSALQRRHEARLDLNADHRRLRDMKLDRTRTALKVIIKTAQGARGVAWDLTHGPAGDRDPLGNRLAKLMDTLNSSSAIVEMDAESTELAGRVRDLIVTAAQYRRARDRVDEGQGKVQGARGLAALDRDVTQTFEVLERKMLKEAEAIIPAARQLLVDQEQVIPKPPSWRLPWK